MGHCEMLLAVAGLDEGAVKERTNLLAGKDWSHVHPAERAAFGFARKMSLIPWKLSASDFRELEKHFGRERAVDVAWWSARCQYMTRVADGFQLPLEQENVFMRRKEEKASEERTPRASDRPRE